MNYTTFAGALVATLAVTGPVLAQSNIAIYGILDNGIENLTNTAPGSGAVTRVSSGGMNNSRFGFRGTEDLGNGLKAVWQLEGGLLTDTGNSDGGLFRRQANVGIEGSYGRLVAGRSFTTTYDFMVPFDPMSYAPYYSWASGGSASNVSTYSMTTSADNLLKYALEKGPFKFGASYALGEQSTGTADGAKYQAGVSYSNGALSLVSTVERANGNNVAATARHDKASVFHVGAMYSSGAFKWQLAGRSYKNEPNNATLRAVRANLYWAGLTWQAMPALLLTGAVYDQDVKNLATNADADPVMYVARARYALSKRTDLYLTAAKAKAKHGKTVSLSRNEAGFADTQRGIMTGIQHRF
ncbi:porin [Massilia sp. S19_KUP03_FR1]|uniref:porin n=1 Tax=Massilia sp. S19_KUP03_FR1 TaxID=3025503 RepID=UPI002FCDC4E6